FYSFIERNYSEDMRHEYPEDTADYDALFSAISVDTESVISEFEHEDMAVDQSGNEYRVLGLSDLAVYPNKLKLSEFTLSTQIDGDNLYSITGDEESLEGSLSGLKNLFFTLDQGGRVVVYDAFIPFWDYKDNSYISDLTIFADSTITGSYSKALSGGCGLASITNVVSADETGPLSQLGYVKDASGNKYDIYEPENYSMEYYLDDYNMWFNWHKEGQLGDFLAIHPILYYQDSLGRWIEFKHVDALSQAECGKPVIYLYPEVETQIDVTLSPQGGFTYTEPVYNDGWSVIASPDGTLINLADGQIYPYLFWEGRGGLYASPSNYWVVEKSQVEDFLTSTLHKYGLNDQETADFMEFWLPRMQASAYYKIGFHGTQAMNILAPMTLSVHPDSVLRILMDYQELDAPIEQDPPVIVPFDREGFAVVEWGGVIW
ncbi:hypothetical protein KKH24_00715, partial [Patescibacteria group bacterium]|nr:hypothetical protein [Patescibacteria group bacterium]